MKQKQLVYKYIMDILKAARVIWSKLLLALLAACFHSSVLYDLTGLERQAVIQTYLKPLKKYDKKKKAIKNNKTSE